MFPLSTCVTPVCRCQRSGSQRPYAVVTHGAHGFRRKTLVRGNTDASTTPARPARGVPNSRLPPGVHPTPPRPAPDHAPDHPSALPMPADLARLRRAGPGLRRRPPPTLHPGDHAHPTARRGRDAHTHAWRRPTLDMGIPISTPDRPGSTPQPASRPGLMVGGGGETQCAGTREEMARLA